MAWYAQANLDARDLLDRIELGDGPDAVHAVYERAQQIAGYWEKDITPKIVIAAMVDLRLATIVAQELAD